MRADSSKDVGMVEKNWRNRKMMKGIPEMPQKNQRMRWLTNPIFAMVM